MYNATIFQTNLRDYILFMNAIIDQFYTVPTTVILKLDCILSVKPHRWLDIFTYHENNLLKFLNTFCSGIRHYKKYTNCRYQMTNTPFYVPANPDMSGFLPLICLNGFLGVGSSPIVILTRMWPSLIYICVLPYFRVVMYQLKSAY